MASVPEYLIDTNILLRLSRESDPQHHVIQAALDTLDRQGAELYFSLQNIAEFWECLHPARGAERLRPIHRRDQSAG